MGSLDETAAAFDAMIAAYERVRADLAAIRTSIIADRDELHGRLGNTQNPMILRALHLTTAAGRQAEQASEFLAAAIVAAREHAARLGLTLGPGDGCIPDHGPQTSPSPKGPARPPSHLAAIGRTLPVRTDRRQPTIGVFDGHTMVSGRDRSSVEDLVPGPHGGWPEVLLVHVESHVAARMRRGKMNRAELVLNNITCGNRDFDRDWPETCERHLRSVLPGAPR